MLQNGRLNLDVTWHRRTQTSACTAPERYTRSRGHTHVVVTPGRAGPGRAGPRGAKSTQAARCTEEFCALETTGTAVAVARRKREPFRGGDAIFFRNRTLGNYE